MSGVLLKFKDINLFSDSREVTNITDLNLSVYPSDLVLVYTENAGSQLPVCALAQGIIEPDSGVVEFNGESWREMSAFQESEMRGRIGRVFSQLSFVSNLTVMENITLAKSHHRLMTKNDAQSDAEQIAGKIDLDPSVFYNRPSMLSASVLRRAQWVRAFIGSPLLVLLEYPETKVLSEHIAGLLEIVQRARSQGVAVVWITSSVDIWKNLNLDDIKRFMIKDSRILPSGEVE